MRSEVPVHQRRELEVIAGLPHLGFGQLDQLGRLVRLEPELFAHRARHRRAFGLARLAVDAGDFDQQRRGGQLNGVLLPLGGRARVDVPVEELADGVQHR